MKILSSQNRMPLLQRHRKRRIAAPGSSPGTLNPSPSAASSEATYLDCDSGSAEPQHFDSLTDIPEAVLHSEFLWIDVQGLADTKLVEQIGERYKLHPLVIADIINTGQRPKADVFEAYTVIILREPCQGFPFESEQIAIVVGQDFLLTFQERLGDIFNPVRSRMAKGSRRMKDHGAPYIAYALLDAIVDAYFPLLEVYGDKIEALELKVMASPEPEQISEIHMLKRELLEIRRALWSQREAINVLLREESDLVTDGLMVYLKDCADHSFQLLDIIEVYREIAHGLVELHLSSVSNRMNEIMKVLTIVATIFIPMTFIVGLYGMNFDRASAFNMPELGWKYGYPYALSLMVLSTAGMLSYFWRKGWIGRRSGEGVNEDK